MKRVYSCIVALLFLGSVLFSAPGAEDTEEGALRVGMVTDAGTIDDRSFNQGTWEGILLAEETLGIQSQYLRPGGITEADFIIEIENLYDTGYQFIVTPGFAFATTIYQVQQDYPDAYFVLIDATPSSSDGTVEVGPNTVSIFFTEHESGFIAGVASALQLQTAEFGFIGGLAIPPVQKFNWGFQQGLAYANANFGTNATMQAENVVYQGTFTDVAAGQQIAAQMYDRGVSAIFAAAGGVGIGAINEARVRARDNGEEVWVIGVDSDQYNLGVYGDGNDSVILTSALKEVGVAAFNAIEAYLAGEFPGGQVITEDVSSGGVGLPPENPNLSAGVLSQVDSVVDQMIAGSISVSDQQGNLIP